MNHGGSDVKKRPKGGKGRATGLNRDYQELAKAVIDRLREKEDLIPYSGDGIDVPIELGGTTWTFDVLMSAPAHNSLVVVECKNYTKRMKRKDIAAFAYCVGLLNREEEGKFIRAYYFTKRGYQAGAEKAAKFAGIECIICGSDLNLKETL